MRFHVIGSSGTYPTPGNPGSGHVLETASHLIGLDAGPGTYMPMLDAIHAMGRSIDDMHLLILSHRHIDHCADVFAYLHRLAYGPPTSSSLRVAAPRDVLDRIVRFMGLDEGHIVHQVVDFEVVGHGDRLSSGDLEVTFADASHSVPAVVTRIDGPDGSLVYTGDTGPGEWVDVAAGVDVLVAEATLSVGAEPWEHHLSAAQAAIAAEMSGARRLVLTHLRPTVDSALELAAAREHFAGPIDIAMPGMTIDVRR